MPYSYEPHYWDDFEVGQTFESVGRTITESDFVMYSMFADDWTELHTNREYAEENFFGERVAHGPMTFVVATGLVHRTGIVERTVVAFLGMNYMNIPAPVHMNDTVSAELAVTEKRDLDRDDAGFVTIDATLTNQEDTVVFEGDLKFMIKTKA